MIPGKKLYKVVAPEDWQQSREEVILPSIDDAFIHFAMNDQVSRVVGKFWADKPFVVLEIDPKEVKGRWVLEANPGGSTQYWHLYEGSIAVSAVQRGFAEWGTA